MVRCPSGRRSTPGKCVSRKASRVRIPPSPPINKNPDASRVFYLTLLDRVRSLRLDRRQSRRAGLRQVAKPTAESIPPGALPNPKTITYPTNHPNHITKNPSHSTHPTPPKVVSRKYINQIIRGQHAYNNTSKDSHLITFCLGHGGYASSRLAQLRR